MPSKYLDATHHVVRYVPWAKLRKDENENVLGVLGVAFRLREDEEYLSATWCEFFEGSHDDCISKSVAAIRASRIDVKPRSGFAVGNVQAIGECCASHKKRSRIRFLHEETDDNPAHAALRGWPADNDDLLDILADDVWSRTILNKDIP